MCFPREKRRWERGIGARKRKSHFLKKNNITTGSICNHCSISRRFSKGMKSGEGDQQSFIHKWWWAKVLPHLGPNSSLATGASPQSPREHSLDSARQREPMSFHRVRHGLQVTTQLKVQLLSSWFHYERYYFKNVQIRNHSDILHIRGNMLLVVKRGLRTQGPYTRESKSCKVRKNRSNRPESETTFRPCHHWQSFSTMSLHGAASSATFQQIDCRSSCRSSLRLGAQFSFLRASPPKRCEYNVFRLRRHGFIWMSGMRDIQRRSWIGRHDIDSCDVNSLNIFSLWLMNYSDVSQL